MRHRMLTRCRSAPVGVGWVMAGWGWGVEWPMPDGVSMMSRLLSARTPPSPLTAGGGGRAAGARRRQGGRCALRSAGRWGVHPPQGARSG